MSRRSRRSPAPLAMLLAILVGVSGSYGVLRAGDVRKDSVRRVEGLNEFLDDPSDSPSENYLLVGSDSRDASLEVSDGTNNRRSDTIMVLRREQGGGAALLSIPRDLWVDMPGIGLGKINGAYNEGPDVLAATVRKSLGIPIQHYVEIDFNGFRGLVDSIGGVEMCFQYATKDAGTGLDQQPGCRKLSGEQALAYARSRKFEEFRDGEWQMDPRADLGRIERQQNFIRLAVNHALDEIEQDPFAAARLLDAVLGAVRIDNGLDPDKAAESLRAAAEEGLITVQIPVRPQDIDGQAVVTTNAGAEEILDYFRGKAPLPATVTSTAPTG